MVEHSRQLHPLPSNSSDRSEYVSERRKSWCRRRLTELNSQSTGEREKGSLEVRWTGGTDHCTWSGHSTGRIGLCRVRSGFFLTYSRSGWVQLRGSVWDCGSPCMSLSELHQSAGSACKQFVTTSGSAVVQRTKTKFAERAFSVVGPSVWNYLPADLRLESDAAVFERKLKNYLFCCVFTQ